jgi:hypothetical protein
MEMGGLESTRSNLYLRLSGLESAVGKKQKEVNDLKLRGILEKDTSVRAQINELGEEVQKQLSTQQMEVESVQSQIRNLDQQIEMAKATASTPSVSNRSITSSSGAPMSAMRTGELFPQRASAAGDSKLEDDDHDDDADDVYNGIFND